MIRHKDRLMMTRLLLTLLLLLASVSAPSTTIVDKGDWSGLSRSAQMGYVIAVIDTRYYVVSKDSTEDFANAKVRNCIEGMNTDDIIEIINSQYDDLENYKTPAWVILVTSLNKVCGLASDDTE